MNISRKCRFCSYYRNDPHKIVWEFDNEIQYFDGVCNNPDIDSIHTNAGDSCPYFRKTVIVGPVLGAYNKGAGQ